MPTAFGNALGESVVEQMQPKISGTGAVFNWDDADMDAGTHEAAARDQQWIENSDAIQARRMHEVTSGDQARDNFRMTEQAYRQATDEGAIVRPGDQLWKMAGYNKVAFGRLMKGMGLDDPNLVQVGNRVKFDWDVSAGEAASAANRFFTAGALAKAARANTSALNGMSSSNIGNVEFGSGPAAPGSFMDVMGPPLTSRDRVMGTVNMANNIASKDLTREQLLGALGDVKSAFRDATTNEEQLWLRGAALSLHEAGASRGLLKPGETVGSPEFFGSATASMGFGGSNGAVPSGISPASGYAGPSFRPSFRPYSPTVEVEGFTNRSIFATYPDRTTLQFGSVEEQTVFLSTNIPGLTRTQAESILNEGFSRKSSVVFGGSRVRGDFTDKSDLDVGFGALSVKQAERVIDKVNSQGNATPLETLTIVPGKSTRTIEQIISPEEFFQRSGVRAGGDLRVGEPYVPSGSVTVTKDGRIVLIPPGKM